MEKLIPAFEQSVFKGSFTNSIIDIAEIGIDSILEEGLLKNLPIINTLLGTTRTFKNIYERNMLKNTALFLNELNSSNISELRLQEYKDRIHDEKVKEQELGRVLILLNQYVDNIKSLFLGKLFFKYVNQEYTWDKFCELSDILGRLFLSDLSWLTEITNSENETATYHIHKIPYNIKRLESLGLVELYGDYSRFGDRLLQSENMHAQLTDNGKIFKELQIDFPLPHPSKPIIENDASNACV